MKQNAMRTNLARSIRSSLGRYIAIAMIIALGASIFVGLRMTKADMVATGQKYTDQQNMFDLRLVCSYGWGQEQLDQVRQWDGLVDVEGVFYTDMIVSMGQNTKTAVYRFYSIPETVNRLVLLGGRMPQAPSECLVDGYSVDDSVLGKRVVLTDENDQDTLENLNQREFTVVGYVSSPLYMDMNRGNTSVGNGSIQDCIYIPREAVEADYFTEIHMTIPGDHKIYSESYNDAMDALAEALKPLAEPLAQERLEEVRREAEEAYQEGWEEYQEGFAEYCDGSQEAFSELQKGYAELLDGQRQIEENEQKLKDGEKQIADGKIQIQEGRVQLMESRQTFAKTKADAYEQLSKINETMMESFQQLTQEMQAVTAGLLENSTALISVNGEIAQIEAGLTLMDSGISLLQTRIDLLDSSIAAAKAALETVTDEAERSRLEDQIQREEATKAELTVQMQEQTAKREEYAAEHAQELEALKAEQSRLESEKTALEDRQARLEENLSAATEGLLSLTSQQNQMESQFAAAEAQLTAAEAQIESSEALLLIQEQTIAEGWVTLEEAKTELEAGWKEYNEGKQTLQQELQDARIELSKGEMELADARKTIDEMTENTLHVLDRNTNIGYASLDSSSDIVAGVSKVFPVFFLLVAALVCITTMTRMVDEERTQIGTLKALGYSNGAIVSKYLIYAGSSAVLGCGLGVLAGSVAFPMILWEAYKIMLFIQDSIVLTFDIGLCLAVVLAYTVVELAVTWYCCHKALEEVPAELIRPKAPTVGKQLLFEKLPFWNKVSFLNKVTVRNIFRYKQRLAMMLVGIGGCTALLLTGFGLRDSIVNIVDFQFEDITVYDMEVYFTKGQTKEQQSEFRQEISACARDVMFFHQTSVEIDFDDQVREIYMICAEEDVQSFIDFHNWEKKLSHPGPGEMLLSSGVAEALGVESGDTVTLRDADMRTMELRVSGVYYNHVYNYAIVSPETVEEHWGTEPEIQMAYVRVRDGYPVHEVSAQITGMDNVMNVSVSEDLAHMVRNMMEALNLVVVVIVFCAALLAATVLYNLTNININERIREIATIKVLGFNAKETAMYIFKENLSLSVMGAAVGLLLGKLLLEFVMSQIKINMVWFLARALPMSYLLSVVMTILMAVIVDFVFYFKLEKVNMAEALKSVE